jgi:hypothetical protein
MSFKSVRSLAALAIVTSLLLTERQAKAEMVSIVNAGFESTVLPVGAYTGVDPPGWLGGTGGTFHPNSSEFSRGAPEGVNTFYSNGGTEYQILTANLMPGTYTLMVDVGQRLDLPMPGYAVGLLAGSTLLSQDNNSLTPPSDSFLTSIVTYTATASDPYLGQALQIQLFSAGTQVNFDDVRLNFSPASVPEPASLIMLSTGGVCLLSCGLRRRIKTSSESA